MSVVSEAYVRFLYRFRFLLLFLWLCAAAAAALFVGRFLASTTLTFEPPVGTPAAVALAANRRLFPNYTSDMAVVVYFEDGESSGGSGGAADRDFAAAHNITAPITTIPSVKAFVTQLTVTLLEKAKAAGLTVDIADYYLLRDINASELASAMTATGNNKDGPSTALAMPLLLVCEFTSSQCRDFAATARDVMSDLQASLLRNATLNRGFQFTSANGSGNGGGGADAQQQFEQAATLALRAGMTGMPMLLSDFVNQITQAMLRIDVICLPIALFILTLTVRSLRLLLLPLIALAVGLGVSFACMYGLSLELGATTTAAPPIMLSLSIAVAVDSSIILLSRFSSEVRAALRAAGERADAAAASSSSATATTTINAKASKKSDNNDNGANARVEHHKSGSNNGSRNSSSKQKRRRSHQGDDDDDDGDGDRGNGATDKHEQRRRRGSSSVHKKNYVEAANRDLFLMKQEQEAYDRMQEERHRNAAHLYSSIAADDQEFLAFAASARYNAALRQSTASDASSSASIAEAAARRVTDRHGSAAIRDNTSFGVHVVSDTAIARGDVGGDADGNEPEPSPLPATARRQQQQEPGAAAHSPSIASVRRVITPGMMIAVVANVVGSAGAATAISGVTLSCAFAVLVAFPTKLLSTIGIACALTVANVLLASLNLVPVLLLTFRSFFAAAADPFCIIRSTTMRSSGCGSKMLMWLLRPLGFEHEDFCDYFLLVRMGVLAPGERLSKDSSTASRDMASKPHLTNGGGGGGDDDADDDAREQQRQQQQQQQQDPNRYYYAPEEGEQDTGGDDDERRQREAAAAAQEQRRRQAEQDAASSASWEDAAVAVAASYAARATTRRSEPPPSAAVFDEEKKNPSASMKRRAAAATEQSDHDDDEDGKKTPSNDDDKAAAALAAPVAPKKQPAAAATAAVAAAPPAKKAAAKKGMFGADSSSDSDSAAAAKKASAPAGKKPAVPASKPGALSSRGNDDDDDDSSDEEPKAPPRRPTQLKQAAPAKKTTASDTDSLDDDDAAAAAARKKAASHDDDDSSAYSPASSEAASSSVALGGFSLDDAEEQRAPLTALERVAMKARDRENRKETLVADRRRDAEARQRQEAAAQGVGRGLGAVGSRAWNSSFALTEGEAADLLKQEARDKKAKKTAGQEHEEDDDEAAEQKKKPAATKKKSSAAAAAAAAAPAKAVAAALGDEFEYNDPYAIYEQQAAGAAGADDTTTSSSDDDDGDVKVTADEIFGDRATRKSEREQRKKEKLQLTDDPAPVAAAAAAAPAAAPAKKAAGKKSAPGKKAAGKKSAAAPAAAAADDAGDVAPTPAAAPAPKKKASSKKSVAAVAAAEAAEPPAPPAAAKKPAAKAKKDSSSSSDSDSDAAAAAKKKKAAAPASKPAAAVATATAPVAPSGKKGVAAAAAAAPKAAAKKGSAAKKDDEDADDGAASVNDAASEADSVHMHGKKALGVIDYNFFNVSFAAEAGVDTSDRQAKNRRQVRTGRDAVYRSGDDETATTNSDNDDDDDDDRGGRQKKQLQPHEASQGDFEVGFAYSVDRGADLTEVANALAARDSDDDNDGDDAGADGGAATGSSETDALLGNKNKSKKKHPQQSKSKKAANDDAEDDDLLPREHVYLYSDEAYESSYLRHVESCMRFPCNLILVVLISGIMAVCGIVVFRSYEVQDATSGSLARGSASLLAYEELQQHFGAGSMMPFRILFDTVSSDAAASSSFNFSTSPLFTNATVQFAHRVITNIRDRSAGNVTAFSFFRGLYALDGRLVPARAISNCARALNSIVARDASILNRDGGGTVNKTAIINAVLADAATLFEDRCTDANVLLMLLDSEAISPAMSAITMQLVCPVDPTGIHGMDWYKNLLDAIAEVQKQQQQNQQAPIKVYVLGLGAETMDALQAVERHFPLIAVACAASVLIILGIAVQSLVAPIVAVFSIAATQGFVFAIVCGIYNLGWLDGLGIAALSSKEQRLLWLPPIVGCCFCTAACTDFSSLLLMRIREIVLVEGPRRLEQTGVPMHMNEAVTRGLCATAGQIGSAALTMSVAFLGLLLTDIPMLNQLGAFLVLAPLWDAVVVRIVLMPAAMSVLGQANFWPSGAKTTAPPSMTQEEDKYGRLQWRRRAPVMPSPRRADGTRVVAVPRGDDDAAAAEHAPRSEIPSTLSQVLKEEEDREQQSEQQRQAKRLADGVHVMGGASIY